MLSVDARAIANGTVVKTVLVVVTFVIAVAHRRMRTSLQPLQIQIRKMPTNKTIKFHLIKAFPDQITLPPLASKKLMPQWFKNIPQFVKHNDDEIQSVKKCIPFLDAMTAGYTLLTHVDVIIEQSEDGEVSLPYIDDKHKELINIHKPIEVHPSAQVVGSAFENMTILKYMSPWIIETPKDYSMLFLPLINQLESPIIPLVGLVDSDEYTNVINFPFIHVELQRGGKVFMPAGTPICQMIPIKRDNWSSKITLLDKQELKKAKKQREKMSDDRTDYYARKLHRRKGFN